MPEVGSLVSLNDISVIPLDDMSINLTYDDELYLQIDSTRKENGMNIGNDVEATFASFSTESCFSQTTTNKPKSTVLSTSVGLALKKKPEESETVDSNRILKDISEILNSPNKSPNHAPNFI